MKTQKLTMAQALIKFLDNQYINFDGQEIKYVKGVLGIFGHGIVVGLGEALEQEDHNLKFMQGKNEQGMGHIAMGFAKQKKRKQIMAVTSSIGPGAMNMVTAAGTATANRIPVLFLPADTYATRQPDPVLQQIEQPHDFSITANDAFKPVSKYWDRINRPEQLMTAAIHAMRVLTDPAETGAVTLCLPQDVQGETYDYPVEFFEKRVHYIQRRDIDDAVLEKAVEMIASKKKPYIVCGGGVKYSEAGKELEKFCETFNIPFGETQAGKGTVLWDHPYNLGGAGVTGTSAANKIAKDADLVIGIGTRLNDFCTSSKWAYQNEDVEVLTINVNDFDSYKMNAFPVIADAKKAFNALTKALSEKEYKSDYTNEIKQVKDQWNQEVDRLYSMELDQGLSQSRVLGELNEKLTDHDAVVVTASGSLPSDCQRVWRTRTDNIYHAEYAFSCMGYEVAGAIGAKLAEPDKEVYALLGDGSFLMLHTELVTSLQEDVKINIVLLDNHGFQCIHNLQRQEGIPSFANEFRYREESTNRLTGEYMPMDFAKVAEGYGAKGFRANSIEEIQEAFKGMRASDVTTLIDIKVLPGTMTNGYDSWWRVGTAQTSKHESVRKAAEALNQEIAKVKQF